MRVLAILVFSLLACNGDKPKAKTPTETTPGAKDAASAKPKEAPKMTNMDPASPEAWKQAEAIAKTVAMGELDKRSDALPFMFMADAPAAVLVHKGEVVKDKGPIAAGAYLRDLGVVIGKGPKIDDIMFVLFAFDAWPPVKGNKEAFMDSTLPSLAELSPKLAFDGDEARITLHYTENEPATPAPVSGDPADKGGGAPDPNWKPTKSIKIQRCVLHIPAKGDSNWVVQDLNWALTD